MKPALSEEVELLNEVAARAGIKMPTAPTGSLKDIDSFCKAPEVDLKAVLTDYAPPPQDKSAILAASSAVKAKIAARNNAVNAYMTAHPGCSHASAWTACRLADPETFAD